MKVIFAQSANAIHFTSFGSLPEGWCCTDPKTPHLSTNGSPSWASGRAAQAPLEGKALIPTVLCWHGPSTGKHHHHGSRRVQQNYTEALKKTWRSSAQRAQSPTSQQLSYRCCPGTDCTPMLLTLGPRPHLRGYVSLSMITLLIFATMPWSQVEMTAVVIKAMAAETEREFINSLRAELRCRNLLHSACCSSVNTKRSNTPHQCHFTHWRSSSGLTLQRAALLQGSKHVSHDLTTPQAQASPAYTRRPVPD